LTVVLHPPCRVDALRSFCVVCRVVIVPELNNPALSPNLGPAATARGVNRRDRLWGRPLHVEDIVAEIQRLGGSKKRQIAAA
jgi:hypothetical protein